MKQDLPKYLFKEQFYGEESIQSHYKLFQPLSIHLLSKKYAASAFIILSCLQALAWPEVVTTTFSSIVIASCNY